MKESPTLFNLSKTVSYIGITGYGGPAILAQMKKRLVHQKKWVSENDFMNTLSLAQILPGATGVTLLGYFGYRIKGIFGWILSSGLFVLPAFLLTTILAQLYFQYGNLAIIQKLFTGLGALVVGLLINAILQLGKPVFGKISAKDYKGVLITLITFSLSIFTSINTIYIILLAGLLGVLFYFFSKEFEGVQKSKQESVSSPVNQRFIHKDIIILFTLLTVAGGILWFTQSIFWQLAATFFQIGIFAFGGGFATIPLIQNIIVNQHHWLTLSQFRDGIAIGQITPGPVFITAAFIGYKVAGWFGALFSAVAIFLPSLLLVILLGRFHEQIKHLKIVQVAVRGILAGFIGIIASVALQFGEKSLINWQTWLIFLGTLFLIVRLKKDVIWAILGTVILSLLIL